MLGIKKVCERDIQGHSLYLTESYDRYFGDGNFGIEDTLWDDTDGQFVEFVSFSGHEGGARYRSGISYLTFTRAVAERAAASYKELYDRSLVDQYEKSLSRIRAYNDRCPFQERGQVVEVVEGKKKGLVGTVSWCGPSRYPVRDYSFQDIIWYATYQKPVDLVLIRTEGGTKEYVPTCKVKVIQGFRPLREPVLEGLIDIDSWVEDKLTNPVRTVYVP